MEPTVNIALRAARKAGDIIARASDDISRLRVEAKGKADFVTEVDLAAEEEIISSLQKTYPDHAFLCEESGRTGPEDADYLWIIDPLDGTSNFMRGIPHYCVSIACVAKGKLEHAVILDPIRQEEFTASRGRGAQVNGRRMRVSNRRDLKDSLIGTGTPFLGHCDDRLDWYVKGLTTIAGQSMGIRRMGSAALDLAYVAAGRMDGFWEAGLNAWDVAAGILLVRESGGLVTDFNGSDAVLDGGDIMSANPKLLRQIAGAIRA
ncbi:MAG: inositol monophosphatase [Luminiphilus sp.]|nr:inositol monophosphatase [Luminiphilus sp.]